MKTPAVIFTCSAHLARAEIAGERLAALGCSPLLVMDSGDKVSGSAWPIRRSGFPRGGNLNGGLCLAGMLDVLARIQGGEDCVLKVDSDMWIARLDEILAPLRAGCTVSGIHGSNGAMRGGIYGLDARKLAPLLAPECLRRTSTAFLEAPLLAWLAESVGERVHLAPPALMVNPRALPDGDGPMPTLPLAWHCGNAAEPLALMRAVARRHSSAV